MAKRRAGVNRREFLVGSGMVAGGLLTGCKTDSPVQTNGIRNHPRVIFDQTDPVATSKPVKWAINSLPEVLGKDTRIVSISSEVRAGDYYVAVAGKNSRLLADFSPAVSIPDAPESSVLAKGKIDGRDSFLIAGSDERGLVYALRDFYDAAYHESFQWTTVQPGQPLIERPANQVRSVMRMFCSDIEDKGWYNDKGFWRDYLTMLVTHRFNRFNLSLGLGYDFARDMLDTYFYFPYPFLVKVPGYDVRVTNFTDAERDRNLEMLRFISDEANLRGLDFQLGLWTHAYQWTNSPRVNHNVEGLTNDTHPAYCREALTILLKECPNIAGVTFRIHGESGVNEGSYDFWKTVFQGVVNSGRRIPIDMHAKGMDQGMIDTALATGLPITISPKYWAEHMGLPYHQAAIRPTELPTRERGNALMALSTGSRSFTRYGYGDLLPEDRKYGIIHRMWPGTQRLLLWGDPVFAAAYGRSSQFCGSLGCEIMEPLSFKGRKGSGNAEGGRTAYKDASLRPRYDFEKYSYTYRLWGRLLYNPDAKPETWQRQLRKDYGPAAAENLETSLAAASRILPLFTTAHTPSAANNNYWPEIYVNMSIVNPGPNSEPYNDTMTPGRFGTVSPLDPQLFSRIEDHADDLINGQPNGKYSPAEVAQWLQQLADQAIAESDRADRRGGSQASAEYRRIKIDVAVQSQLGLFFANKLRAGLCYAVYDRTGDPAALAEALKHYRAARAHWAQIIDLTKDVYVADVSVGIGWFQRGHWSDRIEAIDKDIATMEQQTGAKQFGQSAANYISAILSPPRRPIAKIAFTPVEKFTRGKPVNIGIAVQTAPQSVTLHYRHTHQAEAWRTEAMQSEGGSFRAAIPADYADTPQPLTYYFEFRDNAGKAQIYPGFNASLSNQPYFVIRQA